MFIKLLIAEVDGLGKQVKSLTDLPRDSNSNPLAMPEEHESHTVEQLERQLSESNTKAQSLGDELTMKNEVRLHKCLDNRTSQPPNVPVSAHWQNAAGGVGSF